MRIKTFVSVVVFGKDGFGRIRAKRVIDASGDADFCAMAGIEFEKAGEIDPAQTLTTTFQLANVNLDAYLLASGKDHLNSKMAAAIDQRRHPLPRRHGSIHAMTVGGCVATVAVRVAGNTAPCWGNASKRYQFRRSGVWE